MNQRLRAVVAAYREHRLLVWLIALQVLTSWCLCVAADRPLFVGLGDAYLSVVGGVVLFGLMALATLLTRRRPDGMPLNHAYASAWREVRREIVTPLWLASVALLLVVLPLSLAVFSAAKRTIPVIHPFAWDATLERLGRAMHGGRHAWQWLQPVVGYPAVTVALDEYYHLGWALFAVGAESLVILSPPTPLRRRFLTAWVLLSFVGGTLAALVLSSAGPPYYDRFVHGTDPYTGLFVYLDTVSKSTPLLSAGGRSALWSAYRHRIDGFGFGISAMPSMHVATATLLACLGFAVRRWLGILASCCALLMAVASVALGWHYALDGYVGALLAVALWWLAGRLERTA